MNETIPWNWQDTATLVGCIAILALAFWLSRRIKRRGGSCQSGGCGDKTSEPSKAFVPLGALSIGRNPRGPSAPKK